MEIKIKVPESLVRSAVYEMVDNKFYEFYEEEFLSKYGCPKRGTLVKQIMQDPVFLTKVEKMLSKPSNVREYLNDFVMNEIEYLSIPVIDNLERTLSDKYDDFLIQQQNQEREVLEALLNAQNHNKVKETIKVLESMGYTVTKK